MMAFSYLAKLIRCERCDAAPGEWCRTKSGRRASYLHGARMSPAQEVWFEGFHEGQADAISALDSGTDWGRRYVNQIRERIA